MKITFTLSKVNLDDFQPESHGERKRHEKCCACWILDAFEQERYMAWAFCWHKLLHLYLHRIFSTIKASKTLALLVILLPQSPPTMHCSDFFKTPHSAVDISQLPEGSFSFCLNNRSFGGNSYCPIDFSTSLLTYKGPLFLPGTCNFILFILKSPEMNYRWNIFRSHYWPVQYKKIISLLPQNQPTSTKG